VPDQAPDAAQEAAFVEVHEITLLAPAAIKPGLADMATVGFGGATATTIDRGGEPTVALAQASV
jgi:hypothetical protein